MSVDKVYICTVGHKHYYLYDGAESLILPIETEPYQSGFIHLFDKETTYIQQDAHTLTQNEVNLFVSIKPFHILQLQPHPVPCNVMLKKEKKILGWKIFKSCPDVWLCECACGVCICDCVCVHV